MGRVKKVCVWLDGWRGADGWLAVVCGPWPGLGGRVRQGGMEKRSLFQRLPLLSHPATTSTAGPAGVDLLVPVHHVHHIEVVCVCGGLG